MTRTEPRWQFVAYSFGFGLLTAVAAVIGDKPGLAVFAVVLLTATGVALSFTPWGRLRANSLDERERSVNAAAVAFSGQVVLAVVLAMFLIELARGDDARPWSLLGGLAGASYLGALFVLNNRT
jgi:hypothetical protein